MYFNKVFYNEENKPVTIQFICDKCGKYLEYNYDEEYISKVQSEYCVVSNGGKILCECGNRCQSGLVEPKKDIKSINNNNQQSQIYQQPIQNKPKCPTCSSTNLKKISTVSKAVNTAMFGLLGTKRNKTFHCNNCGYEW